MGDNTPKLTLYKPDVPTKETGWGDEVNANMDVLDESILHSHFSGSEGFLRKTGTDTYVVIKSNLNASTDPTVNEDSGDGYSVGSIWINTTDDKAFVCLDTTVGAAVWTEFTAAGSGISNLSEDTTPQLGGDLDTAGNAIGDATANAVEFDNAAFFGEDALTDQATIAWDVGASPAARVTLTASRTLGNPTNKKAGATYILRAIQDATGGWDFTYASDYLLPSGEDGLLSDDPNAIDILTFYCDGTNMYLAALKNFS